MIYEDLVSKTLPTIVNLYDNLQLPVDYNALKLAIDYIKHPIPEFTIGDKKGKGMNLYKAHREFWLRNGIGKIYSTLQIKEK